MRNGEADGKCAEGSVVKCEGTVFLHIEMTEHWNYPPFELAMDRLEEETKPRPLGILQPKPDFNSSLIATLVDGRLFIM